MAGSANIEESWSGGPLILMRVFFSRKEAHIMVRRRPEAIPIFYEIENFGVCDICPSVVLAAKRRTREECLNILSALPALRATRVLSKLPVDVGVDLCLLILLHSVLLTRHVHLHTPLLHRRNPSRRSLS